jgi:opacity protein-like surface antigen
MKHLHFASTLSLFVFSSTVFAGTVSPFYIAANAGLFQASYDVAYRDQTDIIQQNISHTVQQHGYVGGLAFGYTKILRDQYILGAEIAGNIDSHNARYESGAASAAFADNTQINHHIDLTLVPGIVLGPGISAYLKLGLSYASLQDSLTSPVGFAPTPARYNSNKNTLGFAGGLGIKKSLTDHVAIFAEGDYHDYGVVTFSNFQNFSAAYTHTARISSYGAVVGAAYQF